MGWMSKAYKAIRGVSDIAEHQHRDITDALKCERCGIKEYATPPKRSKEQKQQEIADHIEFLRKRLKD